MTKTKEPAIRITEWTDDSGPNGTPRAFRAAVAGDDLLLTGPEHADLSDEDLIAEARAEYARALR